MSERSDDPGDTYDLAPMPMRRVCVVSPGQNGPAVPKRTSRSIPLPDTDGSSYAEPAPMATPEIIRRQLDAIISQAGALRASVASQGPDLDSRLDAWISECERRAALRDDDGDRLSPHTVHTYRRSLAELALRVPLDRHPAEIDPRELVAAIGDVPKGARWRCGTAWRAGLNFAKAGHLVPPTRVFAYKEDFNAFNPSGYEDGVQLLMDGLERAIDRARKRMVSSFPAYLAVPLAAMFVALTGCRRGEAVTLCRSNLRGGVMKIVGKSGPRQIPLSRDVIDLLRWCPGRGWMFPSRRGSSRPHIAQDSLTQYFYRLAGDVHDPPGCMKPQAMRHAYGAYLIDKGAKLKTVQYLMGHASAQTTLRFYVRPTERDQRAEAERVAEELGGGRLRDVIRDLAGVVPVGYPLGDPGRESKDEGTGGAGMVRARPHHSKVG